MGFVTGFSSTFGAHAIRAVHRLGLSVLLLRFLYDDRPFPLQLRFPPLQRTGEKEGRLESPFSSPWDRAICVRTKLPPFMQKPAYCQTVLFHSASHNFLMLSGTLIFLFGDHCHLKRNPFQRILLFLSKSLNYV